MRHRVSFLAMICFVSLSFTPSTASAQSEAAKMGPPKPEVWWPVQPRPLPLVHPLFSDSMVLQREIAAPVWGWSTPGDVITLAFDGKPVGEPATAGEDGRWMTRIGPFPSGGPHTLLIRGKSRSIELKDVLIGDVWLCSGQSNMNWPVRLSQNGDAEVAAANHPAIRSFTVSFFPSVVPQQLPQPAKWETCTPEFARNFTGVGYFFAREINQNQKIPIGIIHSSVGATYAEVWVSREGLQKRMPHDFTDLLEEAANWAPEGGTVFDYFAAMEKWIAAADPESSAKKYSSAIDLDVSAWQDIEVPKPWNQAGLGEFQGLVWFRTMIDLPDDWCDDDLKLQLSVVRGVDLVWWNGELVGTSQMSGNKAYTIDRSLLRPGKNLLVVAIVNREGPGGFVSAPANMALTRNGKPADPRVKIAGTWKGRASTAADNIAAPPHPPVRNYKTITSMYNGMIAPLVPFAIKGALWYQGEANGPRWLQYRRLLPTLIADWRERFGVGDFPFLIVSLANYNPLQTKPVEPGWAEIRESQWRTVRTVPNTGMAMTIDIGDGGDIHPRNKQEVGRRLALVARKIVYGEKDLITSGPEFTEMQIEPPKGDRIRLYFKNLGGGLMIKPGDEKLTGFVVAGPDKEFKWADAVIDGDTIVVSSPEVPLPKYVRYGWAWNPLVNLYNKEGLPAITFRSDE
ncbi:MAG: sialate O-acetylesterase [Planctomycetaceae bacterium]